MIEDIKMKVAVAQVCPTYYPYIGGVQTHVREISERLTKQGLNVEILTTDPSGKLREEEQINGVTIRRFKSWAPDHAFFFSPDLGRYLMTNHSRYNIIHAHAYHAFPALQVMLAKHGDRIIFTPHFHGIGHKSYRMPLHIPYRFLWARLIGRPDKIICVSKAEEMLLRTRFSIPDEQSVVIPNGINAEAIRTAQSYAVNKEVILYVGGLYKYKNVHYIIKAMPYMARKYVLYIVGDGPCKSSLLQLCARLHLDNRVKILSGLSDKEVYKWYMTCSVFVTLSKVEAFGITLLEAVAAGKPVIASAIPAFQEFANELQGIQLVEIPSLNPKGLADIVTRLDKSTVFQNDLDMFSWDKIVQRVKQVYEQVLSQ